MPESFGQRLTRLRKTTDINQGQLAKMVNVRQSLISMLENDERKGDSVRGETLLRMAKIFGVSMEYLLTGEAPSRLRRRQPNEEMLDKR